MPTDDNAGFAKAHLPNNFGRYQVLERIGLGGFASVYSALDPELNSTVAIKVLADNHAADTEIRRRFLEEARVAREIASDRLVNVYDVGQTEDTRPYVVMQLADRGTLGDRLALVLEPTARDLRMLIKEMATCLTAIHERNIVHRDIKPSNLLLHSLKGKPEDDSGSLIRSDERVVLADFGLARDISGGVSGMTIAGGTAGYMAPEQLRPDGQPDHRADLYAASAIIAAIACGVHPERLNLPESDVPQKLKETLIEQLCLAPEGRPDSATQWADELLDALDHHDVRKTAEINLADIQAAIGEDTWRPPPQPATPPGLSPAPPHPGQSTPAAPAPQPAGQQPQSASQHLSHTPQPLSAPPNSHQQFSNHSHSGPPPSSQTFTGSSDRSMISLALVRGTISFTIAFVGFLLFALLIDAIESESGDGAFRLAIYMLLFGPIVAFVIGAIYFPWPRK